MRNVTHVNATCHTYMNQPCHTSENASSKPNEYVTSNLRLSHVTLTRVHHVTYQWVISHIIDESRPTCMDESSHSHSNTSRPHTTESRHTHPRMHHVIRMNQSRHKYDWFTSRTHHCVISHVSMRHITHNEWVTSNMYGWVMSPAREYVTSTHDRATSHVFICECDVIHSYVWRDSSGVWHVPFMCTIEPRHMNGTCDEVQSCVDVTRSYTWMEHVTRHMFHSCDEFQSYTWMEHVTLPKSHVTHMNVSRHTHIWIPRLAWVNCWVGFRVSGVVWCLGLNTYEYLD